MALSEQEVEQLTRRKQVLLETEAELQTEYKSLLSSRSVALSAVGSDLLSVRQQISDIDALLNTTVSSQLYPEIPRREPFPTNPTLLVSGNPNDRGIPEDAVKVVKTNGDSYYVDKQGRVIDRRSGN